MPWWSTLERYQWTVLLMAWMGFLFDFMDSTLYTMVMAPALKDLLGPIGSVQNVGWYGGMIFSIFLVGWSLGGIIFGVFADYFGRKTTLMVTILIYALFTGLAALATTWWELGLYRFLTGLGVGGEWAAGAALLAESWPERARAKGAALLQTSAGVGYFVAAVIYGLVAAGGGFVHMVVGPQTWRFVFLVGALPGVLVFFILRNIKESERWQAAAAEASTGSFTLLEVFRGGLLRDTIVGSTLASVANFGFWAVTSWVPALIQNRITADPSLAGGASLSTYVSRTIMVLTIGSLPGYFLVGALADRWGRKPVFLLFYVGAALSAPLIFLGPWNLSQILMLVPLLGFFTLGIYALFPIYLPELYPTRLRSTGSGFCFNIGRVVAAAGPFLTGIVVLHTGSIEYAVSVLSAIYLVGPLALIFARETRGRALEDGTAAAPVTIR